MQIDKLKMTTNKPIKSFSIDTFLHCLNHWPFAQYIQISFFKYTHTYKSNDIYWSQLDRVLCERIQSILSCSNLSLTCFNCLWKNPKKNLHTTSTGLKLNSAHPLNRVKHRKGWSTQTLVSLKQNTFFVFFFGCVQISIRFN